MWLNILYSMVSPALFLIRMLLACFGNSLYRDQVFRRIRQAQEKNADPLIYRYILAKKGGVSAVSYTHLDVYKRQAIAGGGIEQGLADFFLNKSGKHLLLIVFRDFLNILESFLRPFQGAVRQGRQPGIDGKKGCFQGKVLPFSKMDPDISTACPL